MAIYGGDNALPQGSPRIAIVYPGDCSRREEMNDTNVIVHGTGTASDPTTYEFQTTAEGYGGAFWMLYAAILLVTLAAAAGFLLGFHFGKKRK
jgi:hypothetical protein